MPRLDDYLFQQYPKFFEKCGPPEVGYGWYPLLMTFGRDLRRLCDAHGGYMVASQIKEKFGALRVYAAETTGLPESARGIAELLIDWVVERCESTCEICGSPGSLRNVDDYHCVRCEQHTKTTSKEAEEIAASIDLINLPRLELTSLSGKSFIEVGKVVQLTTVRYRHVANIAEARLSDIEIRDDQGIYPNEDSAARAGHAFGCPRIIRTWPGN
jgi:hypothetical protein